MKKFRGLGVFIFLAVFALATLVVMLLWNSVAVYLFSVPAVNFWYAAGLLLLTKILMGGWGGHGHSHFHRHHGKFCKGGARFGKWECCDTELHDDDLRKMHDKFHSMGKNERREYIRKHMDMFHGGRPAYENGPEDQTPDYENDGR